MYTRISMFVAAFLVLSVAAGRAQVAPPCGDIGDGNTCFNSFSPGVTTGVYDFTGGFNGILTVQFDTVLTNFNLTVTLNPTIFPLDPHEFPTKTVCIKYYPSDQCIQYDFTGDATSGGPRGVPVKNKYYKGLITLTLSYDSIHTVKSY